MHNIIDNYIRSFLSYQDVAAGYVDGINIQYYKAGGGIKKNITNYGNTRLS